MYINCIYVVLSYVGGNKKYIYLLAQSGTTLLVAVKFII